MPLPGIRCPPNVIARWRARASSTCTPRRREPTRPRMPTACSNPCAPISRMRAAAGDSVDAQARPLDETQDLYTHAFIVFACAAYFRRSRNAAAQAHAGRGGNHRGSLQAARRPVRGGRRLGLEPRCAAQNPMMHLTEAYLAAAQVAEPALFAQRARAGAGHLQHFVHAPTQCVRGAAGNPGNRHEPGHQFEWLSLVRGAAEVFDGLELAESLPRAAQWARRHGVDAMGVRAALGKTARCATTLAASGRRRSTCACWRCWASAKRWPGARWLPRPVPACRRLVRVPGCSGSGGARRYAVDLAIPPGDLPGGAVRSGLMRADAGHMGLMWGLMWG